MSKTVRPPVDEDADDRSDAIERIVRAIAAHRAVELFLNFGGSALYLSERIKPGSRLVRIIGEPGAEALLREFGAGHVNVPLGNAWMARHLDGQGVARAAITRRLRISRNSLRRYLASPAEMVGGAA